MKRKREAFVKVLEKLSWFLLISGLGLILACRSWSQIRVPGLGRDISVVFRIAVPLIREISLVIYPSFLFILTVYLSIAQVAT